MSKAHVVEALMLTLHEKPFTAFFVTVQPKADNKGEYANITLNYDDGKKEKYLMELERIDG